MLLNDSADRTTTITIRPVETGDYQALADFFAANDRAEVTGTFNPFPLTAETAHRIACVLKQDRYYVAVSGEPEGAIVGLCMLRGWDEGYAVPSFGVFVDWRQHGRGLGRRLTEFAVAEAKALGCSRVRLTVFASNAPAVHLYRSVGFEETDRETVERDGEPDVKIVMTIVLNAECKTKK